MQESNDLVPIEIDLNIQKEGAINESFLAMFGGAIETIMAGMFGGGSIPVNVKGTKKQVDSFQKAIGHEAKYLKAMKRYGLDNPAANKSKLQLDRAIKNFEKDTGIVWPFK